MFVKSIEEINERIKKGEAVVVTAEEMIDIVEDKGVKEAAKEVDVVTTGTFGMMCSSGVFFNFGHADPPIKMTRVWMNNVEAYTGVAAVDAYLGVTQISTDRGIEYGGAHVIEDLLNGKEIELRAEAYGTDCYPRKVLETMISLEEVNQAVMVNPRNAYQKYVAATNSTDEKLYTYMGVLLPNYGNVTYSGAGQLAPLPNDPNYETIGIGTRIFLGGAVGYIIGEGTQHNPQNFLGTLMVRGNLKEMSTDFLKAAVMEKYGPTLFVGLGIPIPIINENLAEKTAIRDSDINVNVLDYGVPRRDRPVVKETNYEELKKGTIEINGREVKTSPLSSYRKARIIAEELKSWIENKKFLISLPAERLPTKRLFKPMAIKKPLPTVRNVMRKEFVMCTPQNDIKEVARIIVEKGFDHIPVVEEGNKLVGVVTSWDIANAVASDKKSLSDIMTTKVITAREEESIDVVARRLSRHDISGAPVVDPQNRVIGIITTDDIARWLGVI
ncbi:MAG: homocysteine biosynthesis protein [Candidatus Hydrothermarchaeota archaeon]